MGQAKRRGTAEERAKNANQDPTQFVINFIHDCALNEAIFIVTDRSDVSHDYTEYSGDIYTIMTKGNMASMLMSKRANNVTGATMNDDGTMNIVSLMIADTPVIVIMPKAPQSWKDDPVMMNRAIKFIESSVQQSVLTIYKKLWTECNSVAI